MEQDSKMRVVPISIDQGTLSVDGDRATAYRFTDRFFQILKKEDPAPRDLEVLGREIFYNIFSTKDRRSRLEKWLQEAQKGTDIVFKIESDLESVHEIPFELLYNDQVGFFLKRGRIHMVRDIPAVTKPMEPVKKDALKMLFIISLPLETYERQPLDPLDELNVVYGALAEDLARGLIEIDVTEKSSLRELNRRLGRQAYDIIHFSGHGAPGGRLVLEDEEDPTKEKEVSLEEFSRRVYLQNPVLYFLDACHTARSSLYSPSLAYHLYRASPRAVVIANLLSVYDHLATEGAGLVYGSLFRDTRPGVMLKDLRVSLQRDWWKPVIFASNPHMPLFELKEGEKEEAPPRVVHLPPETRVDYVYRYPLVRRASDLMEVGNHLVLHGVGGSGKSILAGYLARFFQGRFSHVLFMDLREYATPMDLLRGILRIMVRQGVITGEEAQGMLEGVQGLAPEFALDRLFRGVMDTIQGRLFLVLDNLEGVAQEGDGRLKGEWKEFIDLLMAREGLFLLLASRLKVYRDDRNPFGNILSVGEYTPQEVAFLLQRLQRANKEREWRYLWDRLGEIRRAFGFHPLTLARLMERRPGDVKAIVKDRGFQDYFEFYRAYLDEDPREAKKLLALEYPFSQDFLESLISGDLVGLAQERLGIIEQVGPEIWRVSPVVRAYFSRDFTLEPQELRSLRRELIKFCQKGEFYHFDLFNIFALLLMDFDASGPGDDELERALVDVFNILSNIPLSLPEVLVLGFSKAVKRMASGSTKPEAMALAEQTIGELLAGRGKVEEGIGRLESAIRNYKRAIELNPEYAEAYNNMANAEQTISKLLASRGRVEEGIGRLESAIRNYKRALELNPEDTEVYSNMAVAEQTAGELLAGIGRVEEGIERLESAIGPYKRAIELNPEDAGVYNNMANAESRLGKLLAGIGRVEEGIGRLESAIGHYKRAIELNPWLVEVYNNMANAEQIIGKLLAGIGRVEEGIGRLESAIGHYKRAIELNPEDAGVYNNMALAEQTIGELLAGRGKVEEGKEHFRRAGEAVERLIGIYREAGAFDQCFFWYPRFFALALKGGRDWEDEGLKRHLSFFAELFFNADIEKTIPLVGYLIREGVFEGVDREALLEDITGPVAREGFERFWAIYSDLSKVLADRKDLESHL